MFIVIKLGLTSILGILLLLDEYPLDTVVKYLIQDSLVRLNLSLFCLDNSNKCSKTTARHS